MQTMSELMEERTHFIIGQQRGLGVRRAREIHYIHNMRTAVFFALFPLRFVVVHPCTATFAVPRMEVSVIHGKELALLVVHLICAHLGIVGLDVLVLLERNAVQAVSQAEYALLYGFQLEVWTQVVVGNGVFLVLEFLAVVTPVPALQLGVETDRLSIVLQFLHFLQRYGHIVVAKLVQQFIDVLFVLSHRLMQRLVCIAVLAEQLGNSQAGIDNIHDDLCVIKLSANAACVVGCPQLAADVTVVAVLQNRNVRSRFEVKQPAFAIAFSLCVLTQNLLGVVVQTGEECLVFDEHGPGIRGLQYVLTVRQCQLTQFGTQFAQRLFVCLIEVGAVVGETLIDVVKHFGLLGRQFELGALVVHGFDALEKTFVQENSGLILREFRRNLCLDGIQLVVGVSVGQVEQTRQRLLQQFSRFHVRLNRVLESRSGGIADDGVNICQSFFHALLDGGHIMLGFDFIERVGTVRRFPVLVVQERIHLRGTQCCSNKCHSKNSFNLHMFKITL